MEKTTLFKAVALAIGVTALAACNDGTTQVTDGASGTSGASVTTLLGSAFKGPIDGATVRVLDAAGNILATGGSKNGKFELDGLTLPADDQVVFVETAGGQYTDEATGQPVSPGSNGLMTAFTAGELRDIIKNRQVLAMTPETTLMAELVKEMVASGKTPSEAIAGARKTV